ncbi:hypothetical protein KBD61_05275 [Patescibacteria group bacterium]|nr:hypothetical protein [Patescibacteria group bacterium]MBP9710401.1 hypothetical protein [Patescibacteria group bacterium]
MNEVPPPLAPHEIATPPVRPARPMDAPLDPRAADRQLNREMADAVRSDPENTEYLDNAMSALREIKKADALRIDLRLDSESPNMTPEDKAVFNDWVKNVQSGEQSVPPPRNNMESDQT